MRQGAGLEPQAHIPGKPYALLEAWGSWAVSADVLTQGGLVGWGLRGPQNGVCGKEHFCPPLPEEASSKVLKPSPRSRSPRPPVKSKFCWASGLQGVDEVHIWEAVPSTVSRLPRGLSDCTHKRVGASVSGHLLRTYKCGMCLCVHPSMCSGVCVPTCVHVCVPLYTRMITCPCMQRAILHQL